MPVYQYRGVHYDLPEGLSNEQAIARIQSYLGAGAGASAAQQAEPQGSVTVQGAPARFNEPVEYTPEQMAPATPEDMGFSGTTPSETARRIDQMVGAGSPIARFAKGAIVDPLLGINQLLAETGVFGERVKKGAREVVKQYEKATQEGRARQGSEGFDVVQLGGALLSPINRLAPMPTAPTAAGRVAEGAAVGTLFGGIQPVTNTENYLEEKFQQLGAGAFFGGLISGGVETAKLANKVLKDLARPVTESGRLEVLRDYVKSLTGGKQAEIVAALKGAEEIVGGSRPTAAQAVADIPEATALASYQRSLERVPQRGISAQFAGREAEQEAARLAALRTVGGDEAALAAARQQREALTAPLREEALTQANIAGQIAPRLEAEIAARYQSKGQALRAAGMLETEGAQQQALSRQFFPVPGFPRVSPSFSENYQRVVGNLEGAQTARSTAAQRQAELDFKNFQLQSLSDNGFFPLRTTEITNQIDTLLSRPGEARTSDLIRRSLSEIRDEIQRFSNQDGIINSADLYGIRKNLGNILRKNAGETGTFDEKLLSRYSTNLKSYIDNAIESSIGGTKESPGSWTRYLKTYEQASEKINQMEIGQALEQKLRTSLGDKERAGVFANAVQNAAQTIKTSTGQARFQKLEQVLTKEQITAVNKVLADVQRDAKAQALAAKSNVGALETGTELPNLLNRAALITNTVLKALKKDANEDINRIAAEMMLDPRKLAAFIEGVPTNKTKQIVTAFMSRLTPEMRDEFNRFMAIRAATETVTQPQTEQQ
jgi:hypothetical protein